jgi:hypothetical protein
LQPLLAVLDSKYPNFTSILAGANGITKRRIIYMRSRLKLFTILALAAVSFGLLMPPGASAAVNGVPVTGSFTDAVGGTGNFIGTFNTQSFGVQNGNLVAIGTLVGTMTDSTGALLGTVTAGNVAMPVAAPAGATCKILNLTLGPLHLNLLGLVVNLNQVHLTINAVPGAGNLLGNLLCAIANLLNGGVPDLGELSALLNKMLLIL